MSNEDRRKAARAAAPNWRKKADNADSDSTETKKSTPSKSGRSGGSVTVIPKSQRGSKQQQEESPKAPTDTPKTATTTEHTVVSGDNLSAIAKTYYGSADNWQAIYEANKETIGDNPSLIRVGQVLRIPDLD